MFKTFKKFVLGPPLASAEIHELRLSKKVALAVFSSDALSSVAHASEEILLILVTVGMAAVQLSWPISISIAIGILLIIVVSSYRETINATPRGGAYIVV